MQIPWPYFGNVLLLQSTLFAIIALMVCTRIGAIVASWRRNQSYARNRVSRHGQRPLFNEILLELELPSAMELANEGPRKLASIGVAAIEQHNLTKDYQSRYHKHAVYSVVAAASAFLFFCISFSVGATNKELKAFAAVYEVVAILYSAWSYWMAKMAMRNWVRNRVETELLRQAAFLSVFQFTTPGTTSATMDPTHLRDLIESAIGIRERTWHQRLKQNLLRLFRSAEAETHATSRRVEQYWAQTKAAIASIPAGHFTEDRTEFYVAARLARQLAWFRSELHRLHRVERGRETIMKALLFLTLLVGATKVISTHPKEFSAIGVYWGWLTSNEFSEWSALILLALTATSTLVTALYLSRGDRSLKHRYSTQERQLRDWLISTRSSGTQFTKAHLIEAETLMIEELIDWIDITSHDTVEPGG